jgi:hypothetical protein
LVFLILICSNQLKFYNGTDGRGLRDITLPESPAEPGTPISTQAVEEASGVVGVQRSMNRATLSGSRCNPADVLLEEKVLHCTWHPTNDTIAVAGTAGLCLYKI